MHVAQLNVGTMVAPTDDPRVAEFMEALDRVNAIADSSPGFVWRLQTDEGNATDIQIFPNPLQLVNMSVWESVAALKDYVYGTEHLDFLRRRAEWFEADAKRLVLWYVEPAVVPDLDEAVRRLEFLERHGSSPYGFGFGSPPPPLTFRAEPDGSIVAVFDGAEAGRIDASGVSDARAGVPLVREALRDQFELAATRRP